MNLFRGVQDCRNRCKSSSLRVLRRCSLTECAGLRQLGADSHHVVEYIARPPSALDDDPDFRHDLNMFIVFSRLVYRDARTGVVRAHIRCLAYSGVSLRQIKALVVRCVSVPAFPSRCRYASPVSSSRRRFVCSIKSSRRRHTLHRCEFLLGNSHSFSLF